jgi:hypothetical protein
MAELSHPNACMGATPTSEYHAVQVETHLSSSEAYPNAYLAEECPGTSKPNGGACRRAFLLRRRITKDIQMEYIRKARPLTIMGEST